jgi:hypothetical protein
VTAGCAKVRGACDTTPRSDTTRFPWSSTVSLRRAKGRCPSALPTRASALDPVGEQCRIAQRTPIRQARPPTFAQTPRPPAQPPFAQSHLSTATRSSGTLGIWHESGNFPTTPAVTPFQSVRIPRLPVDGNQSQN